MDADKANKWLSLVANLGVVAGIILLAYEVNQATLTTQADMISSHQDRWVSLDLSWQDRDFAAAWAKAMEDPEQLTITEMIQLNGFMWSYFDHIGTARVLWELGVFDDRVATVEEIISENAYIFFGNRFARAWLEENRRALAPQTVEIVDRELSKVTADETLDSYNRIKKRINN